MKLKYWGKAWQKGLTLTADLYKSDGTPVYTGFPMTETVEGESAIYSTANVFNTIPMLSAGIYVCRIIDSSDGEFVGHSEIIFNGAREITLLELKFFTDKELMQLRDALGLDGNKLIAKGGQLQKKSEAPHNNIVDTNKL